MNTWLIGGFAGLGILIIFLTQPYAGEISNLSFFSAYGEPSIGIVILLLLGVSGFAFFKASKESNKKK
jgi:hypothetical protein